MPLFHAIIPKDELDALIADFNGRKIVLNLEEAEDYYFDSLCIPFNSREDVFKKLQDDLSDELVYFLDADKQMIEDVN